MVVPSENQLGPSAGRSGKPSVMATSIDDEADWPQAQKCRALLE